MVSTCNDNRKLERQISKLNDKLDSSLRNNKQKNEPEINSLKKQLNSIEKSISNSSIRDIQNNDSKTLGTSLPLEEKYRNDLEKHKNEIVGIYEKVLTREHLVLDSKRERKATERVCLQLYLKYIFY